MRNKSKTRLFFCLLIIIFLFSGFHAFADSNFSVRVSPAVDFPLLPQFNVSIGLSAVLDWSFFSFNKFTLGAAAGVGFLNVPVKAGEPLPFIDIMAGPFLNYRPFDRWTFQANVLGGVYQFTRENVNFAKAFMTVGLGANFHISPYMSVFAQGNYTFRIFDEIKPFSSFGAALGIRFNLSEMMSGSARIKIERSEQYRIFPVSWAWYENNSVALLEVTNEEINKITDVSISFFIDSFMGQPYAFAELPAIKPGESTQVYVTALFNEVMLGLTENTIANGVVQVQYRSLGALKETIIPMQMPVFHRNTMSWDDDRRAAAFVSPRDGSARIFSRYVQNMVDLHLRSNPTSYSSVPHNVRYAAAMFETLRLYGTTYVIDPASSYSALSEDAAALDSLNFPYETLKFRGGDCDDLSILFCSLLEVIGIETAFITIPGHIYMAFEVGSADWRQGSGDIFEINGKIGRAHV